MSMTPISRTRTPRPTPAAATPALASAGLTPSVRSALHRELDRSLAWPPEYAANLSSHLPMALHALAVLGTDDTRLADFHDRYAARFQRRATSEITETAVAAEARGAAATVGPAALGRIEAFEAWRAHFEQRLRAQGQDSVLREALPCLLPGVAAAAFHGPIRVAHAVQSEHVGELARSLAYWAARWQALPAAIEGEPLGFEAWCDALLLQRARSVTPGALISQRMAAVAATPACRALAGRLATDHTTRDRLGAWAADLYARSGDFTVLHLVTACRALRVLAPWIDEPWAVEARLVPAFTAALLASGVESPLPSPMAARSSWVEVIAAARRSNDDHVVKLVHACVEEAEGSTGRRDPGVHGEVRGPLDGPDPTASVWLRAANRAVSA